MKAVLTLARPLPPTDWRCASPGCGNLLGKKYSQGFIILKYKEFITEISGNYTLVVPCRRCSLRNTLSSVSSGLLDMVQNHG